MNYKPIVEKIKYWREYNGTGDEYRKKHDLDCILTGGNLCSDTIFSLWLPLRYTLNYFDTSRWIYWKDYEQAFLKAQKLGLKNCKTFLLELEHNIEQFLPEDQITKKLAYLFFLGQKRCNVMILPYRNWNSKRGKSPYFDYLPHFLWDELYGENAEIIPDWIQKEKLDMFFQDKTAITPENIIDLAGTGDVRFHKPKDIVLPVLLDNYSRLLELRETSLSLSV